MGRARALGKAAPHPDGMTLYPLGIVGESNYRSAIERTCEGEVARICHEHDNPHDSLALCVENADGDIIGYIPASSWLRRAIHQEGRGVAATVKSIASAGPGTELGVVLDVTLTDDDIPVRQYRERPATKGRPRRTGHASKSKTDEYIAIVVRASVFPVTCDCSAEYKVHLAGMDATSVIDCPSCKAPNTLSEETFDRLRGEFLAATRQILDQAELLAPDDELLLERLVNSPRLRTELISPQRRPKPGIWKRWFG